MTFGAARPRRARCRVVARPDAHSAPVVCRAAALFIRLGLPAGIPPPQPHNHGPGMTHGLGRHVEIRLMWALNILHTGAPLFRNVV